MCRGKYVVIVTMNKTEQLLLDLARTNFFYFIAYMMPQYIFAKHHKILIKLIIDLLFGEQQYLLFRCLHVTGNLCLLLSSCLPSCMV